MSKTNKKRHIPSGSVQCERCSLAGATHLIESHHADFCMAILVCSACRNEAERLGSLYITPLETLAAG